MWTCQALHLLQAQGGRPQLQPLLLINIEVLGVIRRALLDLPDQQQAEKWAVPDRQATLQNLLRLIGNDYLLPNTRPALKNWGWITVPETLWPRVKQTPNHYSFRTVFIQIGGNKKIRYQVHTDPGNSRYMYMAEEVWKLDLRVWKQGGGPGPNERNVGDVIEIACSVACLAPYFSSATSLIASDHLMGHFLAWSEDIATNILTDDERAPSAPLLSLWETTSIGRT